MDILIVVITAVGGVVGGYALFPLAGRDSRTILPTSWRLCAAGVSGALCALFAVRFGVSPNIAAFAVVALFGVLLALVDWRASLLPNALLFPFLIASIAMLTLAGFINLNVAGLVGAVVGSLSMFSIYLVMALVSPGLGMGDVKLAGILGLYGGYAGALAWLVTLLGGFILGGFIGVVLLTRGVPRDKEFPFGPSMVIAALIALFGWG